MKAVLKSAKSLMLMSLALALLLAACGGGEEATIDPAELLPADDFVPVISATGVVKPVRWVTLSFPSGGLVRELLVERGDAVEEGLHVRRLVENCVHFRLYRHRVLC